MKLFKCCNDNKSITDEEVNQIELNAIGSNLNNNNQTNNVIQDKDEKNINEKLKNKDKEIAKLNKKIEELSNNLQNNKQKNNLEKVINKVQTNNNNLTKKRTMSPMLRNNKAFSCNEEEKQKKAFLNKSFNISSKTFSLLNADDDNLNKYLDIQ